AARGWSRGPTLPTLEQVTQCYLLNGRCRLEVVLVDVLRREGERRPHHDDGLVAVALDDRVLAGRARRERLAELAGQLAGDDVVGDVGREIAELRLVPEAELVRAARLDVLAHVVREAEPGELHLAALVLLLELLRRGLDAHGGRSDDHLQV